MDGSAYNWISSLPHPSEWNVSEQWVDLHSNPYGGGLQSNGGEWEKSEQWVDLHSNPHGGGLQSNGVQFIDLQFGGKRADTGYVDFYLYTGRHQFWLANFNGAQYEDMSFSVFKCFIASISHLLSHYKDFDEKSTKLMNPPSPQQLIPFGEVDPSVTQKPCYPELFDSLLFSLCLFFFPPKLMVPLLGSLFEKFVSPELILAIGPQLELPYTRFIASYLTAGCYFQISPASYGYILSRSNIVNTCEFWKIGIHCPVLCIKENTTNQHVFPQAPTQILCNTLSYQQLECIIQLVHRVHIKENSIQVQVQIDNLRCDVVPFEILPSKVRKDFKITERYFPSRIVLSVVPQYHSNDIIVSVNQSSDNPAVQTSTGNGTELAFQTPKEMGIKKSSMTSSTHAFNYWKFHQSVEGVNGSFKWILNDPLSGLEVTSSKPQKYGFFSSNLWYKDRYRKASSPFNDKGGVTFAADKYGQALTWTMSKNMKGKTLKMKIKGTIWLTYWPNVYNTSFQETRRHEFCEEVELQL